MNIQASENIEVSHSEVTHCLLMNFEVAHEF